MRGSPHPQLPHPPQRPGLPLPGAVPHPPCLLRSDLALKALRLPANSPAHLQTGEFLGWAWRVVGSLLPLPAQLQPQAPVEAAVAAARAVVGGQLGTHPSARKSLVLARR